MTDNLLTKIRGQYIVGGSSETRDRAARWADERRLKHSASHFRCAHGLLGRRPRDYTCGCERWSWSLLDHAGLWLRDGRPTVLLSHSYGCPEDVAVEAHEYAAEHGLVVTIGDPADAWYGFGTMPIRWER